MRWSFAVGGGRPRLSAELRERETVKPLELFFDLVSLAGPGEETLSRAHRKALDHYASGRRSAARGTRSVAEAPGTVRAGSDVESLADPGDVVALALHATRRLDDDRRAGGPEQADHLGLVQLSGAPVGVPVGAGAEGVP